MPTLETSGKLLVEQAQLRATEAREHADILRVRQTTLTAQIEESADQARRGKVSGDLRELANSKAEVDRDLIDAEAELDRAVRELAEVSAQSDRENFFTAVKELRTCREEFRGVLRQACLLLGRLCALKASANEFASNQVRRAGPATSPIHYRDPDIDFELKAVVNQPLPAAREFCAGRDGLQPDMGLGWQTEVKVCPLNPITEGK